jgi:hypothetical protein
MSSRKQILQLALEIRVGAQDSILKVSSLLRRCLTICQILKRDVEWIKLELNGYKDRWETVGELQKNAPSYRNVRLLYKDVYGKPIMVKDNLRFITEYTVFHSIGQIEDYKDTGMAIFGGRTDLIREQFGVPVLSAEITSIYLKGILESVRNRALEFANNIILELGYGDILSNVFEETRKFVDNKLVQICPSAIEKLTKTYSDVIKSSSSLEWSQIAFACRDIIQDFTDSIYEPDYLPDGEEPPRREQTKNKLRFILLARASSSKDKERKLIESQIEYLFTYFDKLVDLIQKYTHPVRFRVEKEDAHRCVIYTYLIIGDILKILA